MVMQDDPSTTVDPRIVYRVGRVAFFLAAFAIGLSSAQHLLFLLAPPRGGGFLRALLTSPTWHWLVVCPSTFAGFFAAFLLLGRWRDSAWLNRSILFLLIELYLLVYWFIDNRLIFGLPPIMPRRRFDMAGELTMRSIGFVLMMTVASLAFDVLRRLDKPESEGLLRATRSVCGVGLSLLAILALRLHDRMQGWPPRFHAIRFRDTESMHLFMGVMLARPVAGFFVFILCVRACAECSRELARVQRSMIDGDPFRSRSERA